jgi:hypothetical protein
MFAHARFGVLYIVDIRAAAVPFYDRTCGVSDGAGAADEPPIRSVDGA